MKLRIFLPPADKPDAATRFAWMLLDSRGAVLREDVSTLDEAPRAEDREAVVPGSRVLFARLKLPRVSQSTIRELLPYAVEDRLLDDPSHIHAVAGERSGTGETLVAVVDRGWLGAMLAALDRAGLSASSAWPEAALARTAPGEWHLVWGAKRGLLVDGDGVGASFDHDGSGKLPLSLRLALDEAAARGSKPQSVRVHPEGGARLPDLASWSPESSVAFAAGPPWEELARGEPARPRIELLQGEFAPRKRGVPRVPRAAVVLAIIIALLQPAFAAIDYVRMERERARLEAEREAIFRAAFPEAKVVVDPDLQMTRNLAELKRTRGLAVEDDFLARLSRAAVEPGAPARSIEYTNGKLVVRRGDGAVAEASR